MSRPKKSVRLWLRPARKAKDGRITHKAAWFILDEGKQIATGFGHGEDQEAEERLASYIRSKYQPERRQSSIETTLIADVISIYLDDRSPPEGIALRNLAGRCERLLNFWGNKTLADVTGKNCREYVKQRGTTGAARRELEDLRAAIGHHKKEGFHREEVAVWLPPRGDARTRWLTRQEVARLIWAAWRAREQQASSRTNPDNKKETKRRTLQHVARFILVGIYTGSRSGVIASAAPQQGIGKSYVDLENGIFYRLPQGKRKTNKRQPPVPIPDRLLAHMRRWYAKGISVNHIIEWQGLPIKSVKTGFASAVRKAGLGEDVTPHTLRHTAVTWLLQAGVSYFETGGFVGMSAQMVEKVYGHHHPDHLGAAKRALNRAPTKRQ